MELRMDENEIAKIVVDGCLKIHKALGPGLLALTYLKLTGMKLGLLINFNEALIKDGITRIVNKL